MTAKLVLIMAILHMLFTSIFFLKIVQIIRPMLKIFTIYNTALIHKKPFGYSILLWVICQNNILLVIME
jgi:hypothetical protein